MGRPRAQGPGLTAAGRTGPCPGRLRRHHARVLRGDHRPTPRDRPVRTRRPLRQRRRRAAGAAPGRRPSPRRDRRHPVRAHSGAGLHHELSLLTQAGLGAEEALASATSVPARHFDLADRGRIVPGRRADLLLVEGDPTRDISTLASLTAVWRRGVRQAR
ncbi:amidohydrolase family protein [Streptomyces sp. NPDC060131]|uniref:amidohydrolase family protein n=1 Tax=unclassified Streptomyces TaxID=2593676 RepID=UPI0036628CFE